MISESVREAITACDKAFSFLVEDFGYRRADPVYSHAGFSLSYLGPALGVVVDWHPREPLTVWLVRLVDGEVPPRSEIRPDVALHFFDLGDLEALTGSSRPVDEIEFYAVPDEARARMMAESLQTSGLVLLQGDLTLLGPLERRVKDRVREAAIQRFGIDGARQRGW